MKDNLSIKTSTNQLNNNSITYRNAIYSGSIDSVMQTRNDFGIICIAKTHEFICCNNWHQDKLEGQSLFFNNDQKYIYGTWVDNKPQGFNVFRCEETLFMAEFYIGRIPKHTKILIIFEKFNLGFALISINQPDSLQNIEFQLLSKQQVFSSQDMYNLFKLCNWPEDYFLHNQTLIKYISHKLKPFKFEKLKTKLKTSNNTVKLRLIDNQFYRFGYDEGLAIVFDQDYYRISAGYHVKQKLTAFGVVFQRASKQRKIEAGKIYHSNQIISQNKNKISKQNKIYKTNLLMGVNFCNKFYKNPSKLFQFFIQKIINSNFIRNLISGSITTRHLFQQQSLKFSKISVNNADYNSSEALIRNQQTMSIQPIVFQKHANKNIQNQNNEEKEKFVSDRLRLEAIKKQIYESIKRKNTASQNKKMSQEYERTIINKEMIGKRDNVENYFTPEKNISKSRSRKRIFEESQKNIKLLKDFTPSKSQKNLTPFKTKMKNRIFSGENTNKKQIRRYMKPEGLTRSNTQYGQIRNYDVENKYQQKDLIRDMSKFSSDKIEKKRILTSNQFYQKQQNQPLLQIINDKILISHKNQQERQSNFLQRNREKNWLSQNQISKESMQNSMAHNYVPINPKEEKMRKKSILRNSTAKQSFSNNKQSQENIYHRTQSVLFTENKVQENINKVKKEQSFQKRQNRINYEHIPKSRYYIEQPDAQRINSNYEFYDKSTNHKKSKQKLTLYQSNSRQYNVDKIDSKYQRSMKDRNYEYNQQKPQTNYQNHKLSQQKPYQVKQHIANKKNTFKHSNQVYLQSNHSTTNENTFSFETSKQPLKKKLNQTQQNSYSKYQQSTSAKKHNLSYNANEYLKYPNENIKMKTKQNSSYMNKYNVKKSIQKEIQKSPDRHRCYGKSGNQPYLQNSPEIRQNQYSYRFQDSYANTNSYNQYDSPQKRNVFNVTNIKSQQKTRFF